VHQKGVNLTKNNKGGGGYIKNVMGTRVNVRPAGRAIIAVIYCFALLRRNLENGGADEICGSTVKEHVHFIDPGQRGCAYRP